MAGLKRSALTVVALGRVKQRRPPRLHVPHVGICPVEQEKFGIVVRLVQTRQDQRREALVIEDVQVEFRLDGPVDEDLQHGRASVFNRQVNGSVALAVGHPEVGAVVKEDLDDFQVDVV
jgi:hypothetical protein